MTYRTPGTMRTFAAIATLAFASIPAFAERSHAPYTEDALATILGAPPVGTVGEIEVADVHDAAALLSVSMQQDRYVRKATFGSFLFPGSYQLKSGSTGAGLGLAAAGLATTVGTILAWHAVLPTSLQVDNLDYLDAPVGDIETAWQATSIRELIPSAGVMLAGMAVDHVVRMISARNAEKIARQRIESGEIRFVPFGD